MRKRLSWRDWPLASKLAILFAVLAVIPLTFVALYNDASARTQLLVATRAQNLQAARGAAQVLDAYLAEILADVRALAVAPDTIQFLQNRRDAEAHADVEAALRQGRTIHGYEALYLTDLSGAVILATDERFVGRSYLTARWFRNASAGQVSFDEPRYDPEDAQVYLHFSAPIASPQGVILGTAIGRITMTAIDQLIAVHTDSSARSDFGVLWDDLGVRIGEGAHPDWRFRPFAPLSADVAATIIFEGRFGPATANILQDASQLPQVTERGKLLLYDRNADPYLAFDSAAMGRMQAAIVPLRNKRWLYGVFTPEANILADLDAQTRRALLTALAAGLLAVGAALMAAHWATGPIRRVAETADAIAAGNLTRRVNLAQRDEVGRLAAAFDAMAATVADKEAQLQANAERLEQTVAEWTAEIATVYDASQRLQHLRTPATLAEELIALLEGRLSFEYSAVLLLDATTGRLSPFAISDQGRGSDFVAADKTYIASHDIRSGLGITGWVATTGQSVRLGDVRQDPRYYAMRSDIRSEMCVPLWMGDRVTGVVNVETTQPNAYTEADQRVLETIAAQIAVAIQNARLYDQVQHHAAELEQRVAERTVELEALNRELEAFSYSVSHDLRAPLRAIDGFSQALQEEYAGRLDETGQEYLRWVRAGSQQMAQLIEGLLALARVTRAELHREPVDLSGLAATIVEGLRRTQPQRQVEFIIAPGLTAMGDVWLLRAVLENLLGNAWKFTAKRPTARIEFGRIADCRLQIADCGLAAGNLQSQISNLQSVFFVRDDGAGFDAAYADKLFGVFRRLHSADEFEGTGIGLATVRRIIQRHGGRIWAEGAAEQGATFYFTLESSYGTEDHPAG